MLSRGNFRDEFGLEAFIEPGAGIVRRAEIIEGTVHDLFQSDEAVIAISDTRVNHMSDFFVSVEPDVLGYIEGGIHTFWLNAHVWQETSLANIRSTSIGYWIKSNVCKHGRLYHVKSASLRWHNFADNIHAKKRWRGSIDKRRYF